MKILYCEDRSPSFQQTANSEKRCVTDGIGAAYKILLCLSIPINPALTNIISFACHI